MRGAPEGDPKDAPPPIQWPADGWQIKPDVIVRGPEFRVPAHTQNDVVEWITYLLPSGFTKDTWITSLEIKPSVMAVTHHICFTFQAHTPDAKYYVPNWSESPRDDEGAAIKAEAPAAPRIGGGRGGSADRAQMSAAASTVTCLGASADDYRPFGAGKLIPAGSDISVQVHYTPIGKEVVDRPLIGFTVADKAPAKRWMSYGIVGGGPELRDPAERRELQEPAVRSHLHGRR